MKIILPEIKMFIKQGDWIKESEDKSWEVVWQNKKIKNRM